MDGVACKCGLKRMKCGLDDLKRIGACEMDRRNERLLSQGGLRGAMISELMFHTIVTLSSNPATHCPRVSPRYKEEKSPAIINLNIS